MATIRYAAYPLAQGADDEPDDKPHNDRPNDGHDRTDEPRRFLFAPDGAIGQAAELRAFRCWIDSAAATTRSIASSQAAVLDVVAR